MGSLRPRIARALCVVPYLSVLGCGGPNALWVPHSPNPVTLGPVDRIGGHRATDAAARAHVEVGTSFSVMSGSDSDPIVMADATAAKLTAPVLRATGGDPRLDVRVRDLRASAWVFWFLIFAAYGQDSVAAEADVVEASDR